ncbi:MAG: hypothetical protein K0R17_1008 [Rariglobus sp.]|nr:hypothetical protein [Rariglobus sp.]
MSTRAEVEASIREQYELARAGELVDHIAKEIMIKHATERVMSGEIAAFEKRGDWISVTFSKPKHFRNHAENEPIKNMRAKLQVASVTPCGDGEIVKFHAVAKNEGYPESGADEDNTYAKFSPSADLTINIQNPALVGKHVPGQKFYVDFTPAAA